MSKSGQTVVPPHFSLMSDEELLAWYAELQARAINPPPGDVDFTHTHPAAPPMTADELRQRIMTFQGWSGDTTLDEGSPFHNLWHWLSD
ncbi:hypothetical protein [Lentzea sp. NPDC004782]|uniref:hypothetical protein n=1 Tax=Lentzea sp. NPDC004782 TaxID=3154458 RepID=UPI0033AFD3DD